VSLRELPIPGGESRQRSRADRFTGGQDGAHNQHVAAIVPSMAAHTFNVVYEDAGDGWVYAHVAELLPEVHTQGENLDKARKMVKDAIELVLDERRARGEAIPPTGWVLGRVGRYCCMKGRQLERHLTDHGRRLARIRLLPRSGS